MIKSGNWQFILIMVLAGLCIGTLAVISLEYLFLLMIVMVGVSLAFVMIGLTERENFSFLFPLFFAGFSLRLILAVALYLYSLPFWPNSGFFVGDGWGYHMNGWWLAKMWQRGINPSLQTVYQYTATGTIHIYDYYNGIIYYLFGKSPLSLMFINCFIGAITPLLVYKISHDIFSVKAARISAGLVCFWPSLILWSTQNLKDPATIFLICLTFLSLLNIRKSFSLWYLLIFFISVALLTVFRREIGIILIFVLFVYSIIAVKSVKEKWLYVLALIVFSVPVVYFLANNSKINSVLQTLFIGNTNRFGVNSILERLNFFRSVRTIGGSAFLVGWEFDNMFKLFIFIPAALFMVFFAPFPWQVQSLLQIMAAPEMLCWYFLLPFTVKGIIGAMKNKRIEVLPIILFITATSLVLGFIDGNVGTLFRHRAVIMGLFLIFTSAGMAMQDAPKRWHGKNA